MVYAIRTHMPNDQTLEEQQLRIYTAMQMVFIEIFKIIGHSQSEAEENATIAFSKPNVRLCRQMFGS